MKQTLRPFALSSLAAVLLAGCAGSSDQYPSLAVRDAERAVGQFTPASSAEVDAGEAPAASPQTLGKLRDAVELARGAHQQFIAEQSDTRQLAQAAKGAGVESDLHSRALIAIAGLSALHSQTNLALSDLDQLEFIAGSTFAPVEDIKAAQTLVQLMIAEQDAVLDSLSVSDAP